MLVKCSHSKQTAGELYGTPVPDAIGMEENEAYETNTQTRHIAPASSNVNTYDRVGDICVVQNVVYVPAAENIPTVQNVAYGRVSGAAVNTDTEEQDEVMTCMIM